MTHIHICMLSLCKFEDQMIFVLLYDCLWELSEEAMSSDSGDRHALFSEQV